MLAGSSSLSLTGVDDRRGCGYCAGDANMYFGHVEQVGSSERRRKLLLKCPQCGWLYEVSPRGPKDAIHLTEAEAAERFHE
jgi:hypothetical protein